MSDAPTRGEVDARLEAAEARTQASFAELKGSTESRSAGLQASMDTRFAALQASMDTRFAALQASIAELSARTIGKTSFYTALIAAWFAMAALFVAVETLGSERFGQGAEMSSIAREAAREVLAAQGHR
jgi:hypothetical protein